MLHTCIRQENAKDKKFTILYFLGRSADLKIAILCRFLIYGIRDVE